MASQDVEHMTSLGLELGLSKEEKLFYYHRGLTNVKNPILVLLHGYPQSNFMWRHIVPLLPPDIPLFIPDLPAYGRSAPLSVPSSKVNQGAAILSTLSAILPADSKHPIVLVGHDRGARICHRLAVDNSPTWNLPILGVVLLDIVPTLVQWRTFGDPRASMGSFHWPFLAEVELATAMIHAQGGGLWAKACIERWIGKSEAGLAKLREHGALEVYADFFKNASLIRATCDDYRAGAEEDVQLQEENQKVGEKIDVKVLAMYSKDYLGSRYDVRKVWDEWMKDGSKDKLDVLLVGGGAGHFFAEEAPEETASAVIGFYNNLA